MPFCAVLADWTWRLLVNRTDVWGGYNALADRDKVIINATGKSFKLGATTTRPAVSQRGKVVLNHAVLKRHFAAAGPLDVVGLHSTSPANTSRWGGIDIDHHGETSSPADVNLAVAMEWYERLRRLGFRPLLTDSNGKGGFHLLTIFATPIPTARVFWFLKWLTRDHAALGIGNPVETFPKQATIQPGRYGNWLRLPGRHHTREHWSRVWNGTHWLDWHIAGPFVLALAGDSPSLIPAEVTAPALQPVQRSSVFTGHAAESELSGRIEKYLAKLPTGLGEGQHRDDYAFQFACFLSRDLALSDTDALTWLSSWDALQAAAKGEDRLREILDNAKRYGQRPIGSGTGPGRPRRRNAHEHVILRSRVEIHG
jgi:hypothetical protein